MTDLQSPQTLPGLIPANETARLAALHRYKILDTPPEAAFDRITQLAARSFQVPIALISLVDESRAWFKSSIGFEVSEVARDATICSFAILTDEPLIVPDTRLDDRFACNPFVQSESGLRFYAGAPLLTSDGFNLGTLCLLDLQPREPLTEAQQAMLVDLAAMVVDELELRLSAHQIAQIDAALLTVSQGVAKTTGEEFFEALVRYFAQVLDTDYAYIGIVEGDDPKRLRTIATYAYGQIVANFEYPLQDTPCWEVLEQRKICCYPHGVKQQFPDAPMLQSLPVESYIAAPFYDPHGAGLGVLGVMADRPLENVHLAESLLMLFADRVGTELERQRLERERERFLTIGADLQVVIHSNTNFQWVSPAFERILGWAQAETIGYSWTKFVHPEDLQASLSEAERLFLGNDTYRFENRFRHQDGSYRWFLWNAQPDLDQQVLYAAAIDITDRKHAEAALRESEERLQTLTATIPQLIWSTTPDGNIDYLNDRWADYIGLPPQQLYDWNWQQVVHPDDLPNTLREWQHSLETAEPIEIQHRFRHHTGEWRWQLVRGNAIQDEAGKVTKWVGTCTDIQAEVDTKTALQASYAAEQQARSSAEAAREEAQAANRIKNEFLAVLSHELRTPLNPILGWLGLLRAGRLSPAKTQDALATVERNAQLQAQLVEDLLDVSRILSGKLTLNVALVALITPIQAAMETVRLAAEAKQIQIQLVGDLDVGKVMGDAGRLQQVVWNLLANAVKFSPQGGRVEIGLIEIGSMAQVMVSDNGKGIAPEFLPHVFEHFRQEDGSTTRKFGGLGLGLAIARQIVEMHGGSIWVESEGEGRGSTFTIQIPLAQQPDRSPDLAADTNSVPDLSGLQILVVDDEADSRDIVVFMLDRAGAIVTSVASGMEALQQIERRSFDLLASDIGMPQMDGYQLMQQVRATERNRTIPAIALTAYAGEIDRHKALQSGFQVHLTKPIDPETLVTTIVQLCPHSGRSR